MPRVTSLKTVQAQIAKLQKQAEKLQLTAKPGLLQVIKLIAKHKLTVSDIEKALGPTKTAKTSPKRGTAKPKAAKKSTVAPKYKDPVTGATWTGRGRSPKWIVEGLAAGKTREDFAIGSQS